MNKNSTTESRDIPAVAWCAHEQAASLGPQVGEDGGLKVHMAGVVTERKVHARVLAQVW